ncbi:phage tail protein [Mesorhizobium sp. B2-4-6]|uniref:phage tail protein n=1 Tax=Mesorhizobium sp. B2-4-6 TaxID=2589943 RepID=UPI0011292256|nr:phage tail protein [Mesorhizobium sp. B2-4-6]TPL40704.1 hypothetical protein FJ957_26090 [Mesorhizobium sp. B2-4-6]
MVYVTGARPTLRLGGYADDTAKQPEPVSADSPYQVTKVLGRSISIVIGTAPVDGIPVIGGARTSSKVTGYETQHIGWGSQSGYPPGTKFIGNGFAGYDAQIPISSSEQVAVLGYLLAFDPFGDGYQLIRLEINDEVVFDAENGIGASETFRFYGGTHSAIDPITKGVIGANAGAWKNFAMVYLDGYASTSAPSVKAVISNAATASGGTQEIVWITDDVVSLASDGAGGGALAAAYDIADGIIYQVLTSFHVPGLTQCYLSALDAGTHIELYRVPLAQSEAYLTGTAEALAMAGSGFLLIRLAVGSEAQSPTRIYNATTGAIVAEWREASDETIEWRCGMQFGAKFLFAGTDRDISGSSVSSFYAVADIALSTLAVSSDLTFDIGLAVRGRSLAGSVSFFVADADTTDLVYELTFDGDAWTRTLAYDAAGDVYGIHYDPKTGYLIASVDEGGGTHRMAYVDPDSATLVDSFTGSQSYMNSGTLNAYGYERMWAKPGFALFQKIGTSEVYLLSIEAKSFSLFATLPESADRVMSGIFDQNRQAWFYGCNDDVWTEHRLPNTIPGSMALSAIITKAAKLGKYDPSELTFDGFAGLTAYGFAIVNDTNTRSIIQSLADIYGFAWCDTGSGLYFKKPGRDDTFSLDAALSTADLVFGENSAIETEDDADIRQVSRVELEYISKNQGYTSRPASFTMPAISNAIRVEKYSSSLVLTDADAQTFVTEKFFELQARRRGHTFSLTGRPEFLPGDVVSVPSGQITYTVQLDTVALNPSDMTCDIAATDFQTAVSTTVTAVTNTGFGNSVFAVSLATQYIHLDVPLFRYADDLGGTGLRQYGVLVGRGQAGWSGGILYRGDIPSIQAPLFDQAPHGGVIGICTTVLNYPADPFGTTDASTVTFRKTAGDASLLVDRTEAQVLAGQNAAFVGAPGRWEAVGYKTVVDNGDGTFTLSGFSVRGYRGTEVFADQHQLGDLFVMVGPDWLRSAVHPLADLDATKYYKAVGIGQDPSTGIVLPHLIRGAAETPYACVNLDAVVGSPDGIDISWDYRSRLAAGLNPANFGEAALSFEIDIIDTDGVTVARTLTATTNSKHYATADVVADFGADPPTELFFDIYMMSAVVVRGYRARHHVYFSGIGEPLGLLLALTKA